MRPAPRPLLRPFVLPTLAALAVGVVPLLATPAGAAPAGDQLVVSEVYGGGGSASSTVARDFVELLNPTSAPLSVDGLSVQYRSATGAAAPSGVTTLTGTVPAGGRYLVGLSGSGSSTSAAPLPTPDASGSTALAAGSGTVFLARGTTPLTTPPTGSLTGDPRVVDLVGYGTSNTFEDAPAPAGSAGTSLARDAAGKDTDDNAADLGVGAPTPDAAPAGSTPEPPAPATDATVAEVQGTGTTSPLAGRQVRTTGVVTAAYPTGGFNGFFLQTAGTGGATGARTASDALFVYGSAATREVAVGDHVQVTGRVSEYQGMTQLTPGSAADVADLPGAAAVTPTATGWPRTDAERERLEGMLLAPQGPFTVADNYALNQYAELGLASGTTPLFQPTEVADPADAAEIRAVVEDNAARAVTLDDGATTNFLTAKDTPLPYLTQDRELRVGAPVSFEQPVVLDYRFDAWRLQPTDQLTATDPLPVRVADTRTSAPEPVGGRVRIASFNVLNYFTTTGEDVEAAGGDCDYYTDRAGNPDTVRSCETAAGGDGPRGAAQADDLARQQAKLVAALNGLDADVVSLEELENSAKFGLDRDAALATLTGALNDAAGVGTWDYVRSPGSADSPAAQEDEDVIRTGFVYRPDAVRPVGESVIDDVPTFDNARDPLAQAFEPRRSGGPQSRFMLVVNHFKSKGSGAPGDGDTGQGASNLARVAQARELVRFAGEMESTVPTGRVFLAGDLNAYTQEDPLQVLYDAGYTDIGSDRAPEEFTYLFDGRVGSLDHVLGNPAAMRTVTGAHVWNLNAVESVALEYSRYNYNATDFFAPDPYRSSDHDPLVVGLDPRPGRGTGR
ncbi:ExeM/NucH family extracellular endonuclease [Nocardioides aurantiacus]|uniref:LTD domain-containing protein n=1 Tax=Nocardioides aurantiacus TaxID=86796 RepID=A0A3N2CZY6_9ACTN|nr:ExeM/NucH family extracellular endonuclease [Nocardioides aurantiacus]ROR92968.1 hypothetical protein EDD33_3873 [Nocardioides aurantiacus]